MDPTSQQGITLLLEECASGKDGAVAKLLPLVYSELKVIASKYLRDEYRSHTFQTTELVHEAYMKLAGDQNLSWQNRAHFFGIAANAMRQILVDYARKRNSIKRGEGKTNLSLEHALEISVGSDEDLLALDDALRKLESFDQGLSKVVELKFFAGLNVEETACALGRSPATVKREWSLARAWLFRELGKE